MMSELKARLLPIMSTFKRFANKYQIMRYMEDLKVFAVSQVNEAYIAVINYDAQMSQLSVFFRNTVVQYQKTVQAFLDAVVRVLRETQFKLPGSDEMTTLPEVLKKLTSSIASMLDMAIQKIYMDMEVYYNAFVDKISNMKLSMAIGDAVAGNQILENIKMSFKNIFDELVNLVRNMESLDIMLMKIGETLRAVVEKSQEFVDSIKSDYLDAVFIDMNDFYYNFIAVLKSAVDSIDAMTMEQLNNMFEDIMDMFIYVVDQFNDIVYGFLKQASEEVKVYIKVDEGRLEVDLPFPFLE